MTNTAPSSGSSTGYVPPTTGPVTPQEIYYLLIGAGASTVQAIGIMANMINESTLSPEAVQKGVSDPGYGLVQWENSSYPGASSLVTGNPQADVRAQISFLAKTGGFSAASGATGAAAAAAFASNYEKCASCQPGGQQYGGRVANAATVEGWITSGKWPTSAGSLSSGSGGSGSGGASEDTGCLWSITLPGSGAAEGLLDPAAWAVQQLGGGGSSGFSTCVLRTSQARAWIGAALIASGGGIMLVGVVVLSAFAFRRAIPQAGRLAEGVGAGIAAVPGLEGAGLAVAGAGSAARRSPAQSVSRRRSRIAGEQRSQQRQATQRARTGTTVENQYRRAQASAGRQAPRSTRDLPDSTPLSAVI